LGAIDLAQQRMERRLAAVLAADVAGYSRLMGIDEEDTLAQLKAHRREFIDPKISEHRGRIVKTTGDGMLIEFMSVVDAARCAVNIQRGMAERNAAVDQNKQIEFRIGVNIGDIIIDGDDIFGDGVNVAARLESIAEPGGICISEDAFRQIRGKIDNAFEDLGEQRLKNITNSVRVYRVRLHDPAGPKPALALPDKPSIAVLPFQNMSGDPEQEYFADGMVEDIITALSRFPDLFVIARNSSFVYKGQPVDVAQASRELGVRYLLQGSVRRSGDRVRITGQLIDATSRAHLWGDRFDGMLEDVFDLQDRITERVVGELLPSIMKAEIERAKRKPPASLAAYDYVLRAMPLFAAETGAIEAADLLNEALRLDPEFAQAHAMLAHLNEQRYRDRADRNRDEAKEAAERHARAAVAYGWDDGWALAHAGFVLAIPGKDVAAARSVLDRAVFLNPNSAVALSFRSIIRATTGDPRAGIADAEKALRLSPRDPFAYSSEMALTFAHFDLGDYKMASLHARRALDSKPDFVPARMVLALAALAHEDRAGATAHLKWFAKRFNTEPVVVLAGIIQVLPPGPVHDKMLAILQSAA
jgi:TolB-like protein/class 3 adenylate cyclase